MHGIAHLTNQTKIKEKNAQKVVPPASLSCGGSSHHLASHDIYDGSGSVAGDSGGYVIHQPITQGPGLVSAPNVIEQWTQVEPIYLSPEMLKLALA